MANGDFTLTVSLNGTTTSGRSENISVSKVFTGVAQAVNQEMTVTDTLSTIFKIDTVAGAGQLVSPIKCIVIKNLDSTDTVTIGLVDTGAKASYVPLKLGEVLVLCDNTFDANATGGVVGSLTSLDSITAQFPSTQSGNIEMLVIK